VADLKFGHYTKRCGDVGAPTKKSLGVAGLKHGHYMSAKN
jgi:hypothetical protein